MTSASSLRLGGGEAAAGRLDVADLVGERALGGPVSAAVAGLRRGDALADQGDLEVAA